MSTHSIEQVLHFNLAVAEVIGRLDARILGRARPTGESRLLREIGSEGAEVRALRARLHLDSGYLSLWVPTTYATWAYTPRRP